MSRYSRRTTDSICACDADLPKPDPSKVTGGCVGAHCQQAAVNGKRIGADVIGGVASAFDWSTLMARAQGGDGNSYRRLLEEITPYLRRLFIRSKCDAADVEDVVQDVLLTLHAMRHTYDPSRPFGSWLVAIANRRCVDRLRRQGRRRRHETALTEKHEMIAARTEGIDPSDRRALEVAVQSLPPKQQQAVVLLKLQDLSLKEAAAISGMSITSLKVATHRALTSLRKMLSKRSAAR